MTKPKESRTRANDTWKFDFHSGIVLASINGGIVQRRSVSLSGEV